MRLRGETVLHNCFRLFANLVPETLFRSFRLVRRPCRRRLGCPIQAVAVFNGSLLCLGTLSLALPANVLADSTISAAVVVQTFDILPNTLDEALNQFARQTDIKLSFDAAETKEIMTQGLQGNFTVQAGLDQLLAGTGLEATPEANGYTVKKAPTSPPAATASSEGATVLPSVVVSASKGRDYTVAETVTATRTNTLLRDIPQSITVVTQDQIKDQNMLSMTDAVRYVPGVTMAQGEGNADSVVIRGSQSTGDFFMDGMRDDVEYLRDLYNLERVEVLKGPNGMIFGRGGSGGVVNRVTKQAGWDQIRSFSFQGGSFDTKRLLLDVGQGIHEKAAVRLNGMFESSGSFRDDVHIKRHGISPTVTLRPTDRTNIILSGEYFRDDRTADRGIPSFAARPVDTARSTFFGNPFDSSSKITVQSLYALIEHGFENGIKFRNVTRYAVYDKFYQNIFPTGVSEDGSEAIISAYNNSTKRENIFNRSELMYALNTGPLEHRLLAGIEVGKQITNNLRKAGYFGTDTCQTDHLDDPEDDALPSSINVPISNPITTAPVDFRLDECGLTNRVVANITGLYIQDQLKWSKLEAILGLRYDNFQTDAHNNRTGQDLRRTDGLLAPRAGLIFKPIERASIYWSYSLAYVPRAGDQLNALEFTNASLAPERFINLEVGAKWDIRPNLSLTVAGYRLDRNNVAIPATTANPVATLVKGTRSEGFEAGIGGRFTSAWSVMGGYAYQNARVTQAGTEAVEGAAPGAILPLVPHHTFSLWNRYDFTPWLGFGLGVITRSDMFTSVSNQVVLPGYTRLDAALYARIDRRLRFQVNVENMVNTHYFLTASNDQNISPGTPVAVRGTMVLDF
jgi:catecholate siderophore receptor